MSFAVELKRMREARGLSYGQVARKAGVTREYLWMIEHGRRVAPTPEHIVAICRALGQRREVGRLTALALVERLAGAGLEVSAEAVAVLAAGIREAA